jgi:hypothetical protein
MKLYNNELLIYVLSVKKLMPVLCDRNKIKITVASDGHG